jgi:hypothetical protein
MPRCQYRQYPAAYDVHARRPSNCQIVKDRYPIEPRRRDTLHHQRILTAASRRRAGTHRSLSAPTAWSFHRSGKA